jgi:ABC-type Na+ efflux pump permease subunit
MFGDYINNILIIGLNYCLVIAFFIVVFRSKNTKIYIVSIILGFTVYGLTFFPAFSSNYEQIGQNAYINVLKIKDSPVLLGLLLINMFIVFASIYKKNYLAPYCKYIVLTTITTYLLYASSYIPLFAEVIIVIIIIVTSLSIIIRKLNLEEKERQKYHGKNRLTPTR